ncbi:MAG: hypothetical protein DWQ02_09315 [Bacteroidetes bacterium]|nr:MAG: hypothetical protein DWQ02_09315 [Bacteroidota bacterium]
MRNTTASFILLALMSVLVLFACKTTTSTTQPEVKAPVEIDTLGTISISYDSPWLDITIADKKMTKVKTTHYFAETNFSSVPDSMSTETLMDGVVLSDSIMNELNTLLDEQNFWELEEQYGAPEQQRYYPYVISAEMMGKSKTVTYRSNPSYDLAPQAFTQVEAFIKTLNTDQGED